MKTLIIISLIALSAAACTSKKKSYCEFVEKPIIVEAAPKATPEGDSTK